MQAVTVHQIITNPESADSSSDAGAATDALRATDSPPSGSCQCNFTLDTSMIKQLQKSLDDSAAVTDMLLTYILNNTEVLGNNYDSTQNIVDSLVNMVTTLSNLEANSITTEAIINDVLSRVQTILSIQNATVPYSEPTSCQDIKAADPNSPSGYYHIHSQLVYCNMDELCNSTDGWSRIAFMDMSDATVDCPSNLKYRKKGNTRACGRPDGTTGGSCEAFGKFDSLGIKYSKICGRVTGYQYGAPDGILDYQKNINLPYVDGISITRGWPRQHVWTMISGYSKQKAFCPGCSSTTKKTQDFVGNDFFCESGNTGGGWSKTTYYEKQPLWDGQGCGPAELTCCDVPGLPWFYQTMNSTTTDYVELRICGNQGIHDEDILVAHYEIYIQ